MLIFILRRLNSFSYLIYLIVCIIIVNQMNDKSLNVNNNCHINFIFLCFIKLLNICRKMHEHSNNLIPVIKRNIKCVFMMLNASVITKCSLEKDVLNPYLIQ